MALVDVLKIINADSEQKSLWQLWTAALIKSLETVFSQQAADIIRLLGDPSSGSLNTLPLQLIQIVS